MAMELGNREGRAEEDAYTVQRPVYCLREFDREFKEEREEVSLRAQARKFKKTMAKKCTPRELAKRFLSFVPFFSILRSYYKRSFIVTDLIAGVTLAIFHIPQGLAYGLLAGLPPIYGLYTSFFPPLIYVFFGTSRHLSTGTFSLLSLIVADPVNSMTAHLTVNSSDNSSLTQAELDNIKLEIAVAATFLAGVLQVVMGLLHLGFITSYLSDALVSGLTTGAAVHVFTSQLLSCLGISRPELNVQVGKMPLTYVHIFSNLNKAHVATIITAIICIIILVLVKELLNPKVKEKIKVPIPIELLVVIVAAVISYFAQLQSRFGVKTVGEVPRGLPEPIIPKFSIMGRVIGTAFSLSIVGFAISVSLTKMIATRLSYEVDYNQEFLAQGISNIGGALLRCHMAGGNLTRNSVMLDMGMKSQQIANLVSCAIMLLVLLFAGSLFEPLPKCVLGAIIIVALKGMFKQVTQLRRLWKVSIYDFLIWVVSCLAVIFLDVTYGLAAGFAFSILTIVFRTQNPECRLLGRIPQTDIYKDISVYPEAKEVPGIKIFRFDGAVYFANAEHFKNQLYKYANLDPAHLRAQYLKKQVAIDPDTKVSSAPPEAARPRIPKYRKNSQSPSSGQNGTSDAGDAMETIETSNQRFEVTTPGSPKLKVPKRDVEMPSPTHSSTQEGPVDVHHLILDCSTWAYIDSVGIRVLKEVIAQYKLVGISVYMAVLKASVRDMFARTKLYRTHDKNYMYLTVHDAVLSALNEHREAKDEVRMDTILKYNMSPLPEND